MSHVKKDKFSKTKPCDDVTISDMTRFFLSDEWIKIINNPGVLKRSRTVQGAKRRKVIARGGKLET